MKIVFKDFVIEDVSAEDVISLLQKKVKTKKDSKGAKDEYELPEDVPTPLKSRLEKRGGPTIPYSNQEIVYVYKRLKETPAPKSVVIWKEGIATKTLHPTRALTAVYNIKKIIKARDEKKMSHNTKKLLEDLDKKNKEKEEKLLADMMA